MVPRARREGDIWNRARARFYRTLRPEGDDIAGEINGNVTDELCTMKLMAGARAPSSHGRSTSRVRVTHQTKRHAAMFGRLLAAHGDNESFLL